MDLTQALAIDLEGLETQGLRRRLRAQILGLNLGSNDYLGLAQHPAVRQAAAEAALQWGSGSTGSRLTSGNLTIHTELERKLADLKSAEDAILFSSGYAAGVGTIPALVTRGDLIVSDALNHACLIDGCRLSRAEVRIYRHCDIAHARELLLDRDKFRRCLLITEGVFSMDGDIAPLPDLCALCEALDTWLMVDDAHGTGVLGPDGTGTAAHFGVSSRVPIQMGTLSKALGSEGGFVAGSSVLIEYLRNNARSFIFSTAPAPATVAAARTALGILRSEPDRRTQLLHNAKRMRSGLSELGLNVLPGETPIIPIIIGDASEATRFSVALEDFGVWAPSIRPPTVPLGLSRLRVTVTASHTDAQLDEAFDAFKKASQSL